MTFDEFTAVWSRLHGGFDPRQASPVVRGWLLTAYRIGSLLGRRRVSPAAVTVAGVVLGLCVPFAALLGRGGLLLGALLVLLAAVADGLDGAVAVVTGRTSRLGYVYDSVADRIGEAGWLAGLWVAGAPGWLAVAAGGTSWLHEYVRARATAAGMTEIGAVTVGERPTRVAIAVSGLTIGGFIGFVRGEWTHYVIVTTVAVWLVLAIAGLGQLAAAVHHELSGK